MKSTLDRPASPPERTAAPRLAEGDLLTVSAALRLLPVGRSTIYALARQGDLPSIRITTKGSPRGRILLFRDGVERLVARLRSGAVPIRPAPTVKVDPDSLRRRLLRHGETWGLG